MNQNTGRSSLMAIAGGYVLYLAYELLKSLIDNERTTMPRVVQILAIIFFAAAGISLLVFAWKIWKKGREDQDQNPVDIGPQEEKAINEEESPKT